MANDKKSEPITTTVQNEIAKAARQFDNGMRALANGITLGAADSIAGIANKLTAMGVNTVTGKETLPEKTFGQSMQEEIQKSQDARGVAYMINEAVGGTLTGFSGGVSKLAAKEVGSALRNATRSTETLTAIVNNGPLGKAVTKVQSMRDNILNGVPLENARQLMLQTQSALYTPQHRFHVSNYIETYFEQPAMLRHTEEVLKSVQRAAQTGLETLIKSADEGRALIASGIIGATTAVAADQAKATWLTPSTTPDQKSHQPKNGPTR